MVDGFAAGCVVAGVYQGGGAALCGAAGGVSVEGVFIAAGDVSGGRELDGGWDSLEVRVLSGKADRSLETEWSHYDLGGDTKGLADGDADYRGALGGRAEVMAFSLSLAGWREVSAGWDDFAAGGDWGADDGLVFEVSEEEVNRRGGNGGFEQKVTKETKGFGGRPVAVRGHKVPGVVNRTLPGEDGGAVGFGEFAPLAGGEVVWEVELADGYSEEAEGGMAGGSGHFADLAVAAFMQREFDPTGGNIFPFANGRVTRRNIGVDLFGLGGEGWASFYDQAGAEFLEGGLGDLAFDLGPVGAGVGLFGVEEFGVESGFVGEKEEAFAVAV
jgi:hypothetical protein